MKRFELTLSASAAAAVLFLSGGLSPVQAQTTTPGSSGAASAAGGAAALSAADRSFVMEAAIGGMAEVRLGELAQRQGTSDKIRHFGAQMVKDHGKANTELAAVATAKGLQLPKELDRKHSATADRLQKLSGRQFDTEYIRTMLAAHQKDVALFERQARDGNDADLKSFAQKNLPTLKQHLTHVEGLMP